MRRYIFLAMGALMPFGLFAATLTLRDGTVLRGDFISGTMQSIIFQDDRGVRRRFDLNQLQTIDFSNPITSSSRRDYQDNSANRLDDQRTVDDRRNLDDRRNQREWVTIPGGASISVRTDESIQSQSAAPGRVYPATIAQDVLDNVGNIAIPRGAEASLVIREMNDGGTLNSGNFILDLDSIRVNGRRYAVDTEDIKARDPNGIGKNKRTAEMVGGGAVLGTLLGAIAGGGKGAAIGAAAGAAAGGGVQVLTKGREIRVPAETVLNFRLEEPLSLREAR